MNSSSYYNSFSKKYFHNKRFHPYYPKKRFISNYRKKIGHSYFIEFDDDFEPNEVRETKEENRKEIKVEENNSWISDEPTANETVMIKEESSNDSLNTSIKTKEEKTKETQGPKLLEVTNEEIKKAYFVPKKVTQIYNMLQQQMQMQMEQMKMEQIQQQEYNTYIYNNTYNNTYSNVYNRTNSYPVIENPNINNSLNYNSNRRYSYNSDNSTALEKEYQRTEQNTEILSIKVKISKTETAVFKLRRYDDTIKTVQLFCELNKIDSMMVKPLIIAIFKTLNSISKAVNLKISQRNFDFLSLIKDINTLRKK
ncbi:MAG: hypothetical protein MJ252_24585 [archaeon]|nr:hypothetical protein [archaeon]